MGTVTELKKALLTSSATALLPYDLDQTLYEELLKLAPLAQLVPVEQATAKTHEYSIRTAHPQGWFEGETTPNNFQTGTYVRKSVVLKIQRIWGGVTGYAQAVDEAFVDALATEITGSLEGMADVLEHGLLYGISTDISFTGDAYQYSGILPRIYAYATENVVDAGGNKAELADLDEALALASKFRQTRFDPRFWVMGMRMKNVVDGLQTKVQLPLTTAELAEGKITMAAYGNAPIYESDFVVPETVTTSPACTGVIATGGSLPNATYNYRISSVTMYGEQVAGTASANVVSATTDHTANLTWTHDDNAKSYMIWRRVSTNPYYLLDIIPAKTYDADGTVNGVVEAYTDAGTRTCGTVVKALESGEQIIALVSAGGPRGVSILGKVDDMGRPISSLMSFVELARIKDSYDYFIKAYLAAKVPYPNVHAVVRHVKLA